MSDDLFRGDLHRLYRANANERSSARADVNILQIARAQARARARKQVAWVACAAAVILLAIVIPIDRRQGNDSAALRQHYAALATPYLLDSHDGADPYTRATRFLLDRHELDGQTAEMAATPSLQQGS